LDKLIHHQQIALTAETEALLHVSATICSHLLGVLTLEDIHSIIIQPVIVNGKIHSSLLFKHHGVVLW
jgi:hypothetical protein